MVFAGRTLIQAAQPKAIRLWRKRAASIRQFAGSRRQQATEKTVEVDTLEIRPLPKMTLKQFTARDVMSCWDVLEAHYRATASLAAQFLDTPQANAPFPILHFRSMVAWSSSRTLMSSASDEKSGLFVLPSKALNSTEPSNGLTEPTPKRSMTSPIVPGPSRS